MEKTYIYNGTEVVKTGRVAKTCNQAAMARGQVLYEVETVVKNGPDHFKAWVKEAQLFLVSSE